MINVHARTGPGAGSGEEVHAWPRLFSSYKVANETLIMYTIRQFGTAAF